MKIHWTLDRTSKVKQTGQQRRNNQDETTTEHRQGLFIQEGRETQVRTINCRNDNETQVMESRK